MLTFVSLACCVGMCGLWVRSYRWCESLGFGAGQYWVDAYAVGGLVVLNGSRHNDVPESLNARLRGYSQVYTGWKAILETAGVSEDESWGTVWFGYGGVSYTTGPPYARTIDHRSIWFPVWLAVLLTLIPPALWLRRRWKLGNRGFPVEKVNA
jgi:hypothetical protein